MSVFVRYILCSRLQYSSFFFYCCAVLLSFVFRLHMTNSRFLFVISFCLHTPTVNKVQNFHSKIYTYTVWNNTQLFADRLFSSFFLLSSILVCFSLFYVKYSLNNVANMAFCTRNSLLYPLWNHNITWCTKSNSYVCLCIWAEGKGSVLSLLQLFGRCSFRSSRGNGTDRKRLRNWESTNLECGGRTTKKNTIIIWRNIND